MHLHMTHIVADWAYLFLANPSNPTHGKSNPQEMPQAGKLKDLRAQSVETQTLNRVDPQKNPLMQGRPCLKEVVGAFFSITFALGAYGFPEYPF